MAEAIGYLRASQERVVAESLAQALAFLDPKTLVDTVAQEKSLADEFGEDMAREVAQLEAENEQWLARKNSKSKSSSD